MLRLNQITAPATDLPASVDFYKALGLKLIVLSQHYARFELPAGEATFSLHFTLGAIARENAPAIYFECNDLDFEVARLKQAGIAFEKDPVDQPWLWREAWLRDPAGNALCLYHAGENRRFPPWRLDPDPGPRQMHILLLEDGMKLVKRPGEDAEAWRALQDAYPTYKTSLGPYDLYDTLAMLEHEWPDIFIAHAPAIRAFIKTCEMELEL